MRVQIPHGKGQMFGGYSAHSKALTLIVSTAGFAATGVIQNAGNRHCFFDSLPWPLTFDSKNKRVSRLVVEHVYVQFDNCSCIGLKINFICLCVL